jgi:hypothetical protein
MGCWQQPCETLLFGENWGVPGSGIGRNLFERPLHWEYFYDVPGKALVRLHRLMGTLSNTESITGSNVPSTTVAGSFHTSLSTALRMSL